MARSQARSVPEIMPVYDSVALLQAVGRKVTLAGKITVRGNSQVLEWYPGHGGVELNPQTSAAAPEHYYTITGRLEAHGDTLCLVYDGFITQSTFWEIWNASSKTTDPINLAKIRIPGFYSLRPPIRRQASRFGGPGRSAPKKVKKPREKLVPIEDDPEVPLRPTGLYVAAVVAAAACGYLVWSLVS